MGQSDEHTKLARPDLVVSDSIGGSVRGSDGAAKVSSATLICSAEGVSMIVQAVGAVAALLLFIYLSFIYPNVATVIIPLCINKLIDHLAEQLQQQKQAKEAAAKAAASQRIEADEPKPSDHP